MVPKRLKGGKSVLFTTYVTKAKDFHWKLTTDVVTEGKVPYLGGLKSRAKGKSKE